MAGSAVILYELSFPGKCFASLQEEMGWLSFSSLKMSGTLKMSWMSSIVNASRVAMINHVTLALKTWPLT